MKVRNRPEFFTKVLTVFGSWTETDFVHVLYGREFPKTGVARNSCCCKATIPHPQPNIASLALLLREVSMRCLLQFNPTPQGRLKIRSASLAAECQATRIKPHESQHCANGGAARSVMQTACGLVHRWQCDEVGRSCRGLRLQGRCRIARRLWRQGLRVSPGRSPDRLRCGRWNRKPVRH